MQYVYIHKFYTINYDWFDVLINDIMKIDKIILYLKYLYVLL